MVARTPGRWTFTTTSRSCGEAASLSYSARNRARWTCPMVAAANARSSNQEKTSESGADSEDSNSARIASNATGGTASCSLRSSSTSSLGSSSGRVDATCPSFMNDGPRSSSTIRMRSGQAIVRRSDCGIDERGARQERAEAHAAEQLAEPVLHQDERDVA